MDRGNCHGVEDRQKRPKVQSHYGRNPLTFYEKIAVIRYYDESRISHNRLAKMFHCCTSQIKRILAKKAELMQQLATMSETEAANVMQEVTRKKEKFEITAINFLLHQWTERCRQVCPAIVITTKLLRNTATRIAAILNAPKFRATHRWLSHFRKKYDCEQKQAVSADVPQDDDGSPSTMDHAPAALPINFTVEDIILEFRDALPSFMQKEIAAIASSAPTHPALTSGGCGASGSDSSTLVGASYSTQCTTELSASNDCTARYSSKLENRAFPSESVPAVPSPADVETIAVETDNSHTSLSSSATGSPTHTGATLSAPSMFTSNTVPDLGGMSSVYEADRGQESANAVRAGTAALLSAIFPHLAVIHQFAILNSDAKALELLSLLGVHIRDQASAGAYDGLSMAMMRSTATTDSQHPPPPAPAKLSAVDHVDLDNDFYAPDLDDIVLIE